MIKQEILKEIEDFKAVIATKNNAVEATKELAISTAAKVQVKFNQFSQTESIDERIQVLIEACREVVSHTESFHNELEKEVQSVQLQIETLENLLSKLEHHFDLPEAAVSAPPQSDTTIEESEVEALEGEKK